MSESNPRKGECVVPKGDYALLDDPRAAKAEDALRLRPLTDTPCCNRLAKGREHNSLEAWKRVAFDREHQLTQTQRENARLREESLDSIARFTPDGYMTWRQVLDEYDRLAAEVAQERLQLAACGVASLQNTEESTAHRIGKDNPSYSASYSDVCAAVDREIALRAEVERLKEALRIEKDESEAQRYLRGLQRERAEVAEQCLSDSLRLIDQCVMALQVVNLSDTANAIKTAQALIVAAIDAARSRDE